MKKKNSFVCNDCHFESPKWLGKCPSCGAWNSLEEVDSSNIKKEQKYSNLKPLGAKEPQTISQIDDLEIMRDCTGLGEFDRVMGGGLAPGSLTLIGGQPGIGKSTLLLEVINRLAIKFHHEKVLYVSGEESAPQLVGRAKRLGISAENIFILNETIWQNILISINEYKPKFIVIDSIQTTISNEVQSAPGTISQIREVTYELMNQVKSKNITSFVVGHITKEGSIAGPKILEHMVDCVIYFEGDQYGQYRILRSNKNRFGDTNEVGIFEMKEEGLVEVPNPSLYFLDEQLKDSFGRSLTCIMEGSRPLFIEIQALVTENKFGNGRRTTQGLDSNRLSMMVAIVEKYFEIPLGFSDIYLNVVGGFRLIARESDLSIVVSLLSSYRNETLPSDCIFLGEIGLTGEVRAIPLVESRLKEIHHMNYKKVFTSMKTANEYDGAYGKLEVIGLNKASDLQRHFFN